MIAAANAWWQTAQDIWNYDLSGNDNNMMQIVVGLAGMLASIFIGYIYAKEIWIAGWQIWTWALTVLIVTAVLLSWPERPLPRLSASVLLRTYWPLLLLGLAGFLLRALWLETIPGGLHVDEMAFGDFAMRHVYPPDNPGTISPFRTGWVSQPSFNSYILRLSFLLGGWNITALRISSAVAGTLAIFATYAVVAVFQDRKAALMAAAVLATYHYHIQYSRLALNNIWDTVWVPLMLAAFAWGWRKKWSGGAVIAGLAGGFSQYFYAGGRIGLLLLPLVALALYLKDKDRRRLLVHGGKLLVVFVTVAAPILIFAMRQPDIYFDRTRIVFGWQPEVITAAIGEYNLPAYLAYQLWRNFGAFTSVVDITGFYGPNVPFLIGLAAPLFIIGFFWAIWKKLYLPVAWVLLTVLLGGILISGAPSSSHFVVVIPAICWLVILPLHWLWQRGYQTLALAAIMAIMATDLYFYFFIYVPGSPRDLFNAMPPPPF
ncbi:MAG: glycosyltransferase family 39 protein [Candidatus Promineifilaceae bacterium]